MTSELEIISLSQILDSILNVNDATARFVALIVGPQGSGKSVFCQQLCHDYLAEGHCVLYLTTDRSPEQVMRMMERFGWNVRGYAGNDLRFVDLYSWQVDGIFDLETTEYGLRACPLNRVELQIAERSIQDTVTKEPRTVIDSLGTLTAFLGEQELKRLLQTFNAIIRDKGTGVVTIDSSTLPDSYMTYIQSQFNLIYELNFQIDVDTLRRFMRVTRFTEGSHPVKGISFTITDQGIVLDI